VNWQTLALVSPGESPATYQPTDAQISRVMQADIYLRIGVPFERGAWFDAIRSEGGPVMVDTRAGVSLRRMSGGAAGAVHGDEESRGDEEREEEAAHSHEGADPHIWLAPEPLKVQARTVAEALIRFDPYRESRYRTNLQRTLEELSRLDEELRRHLEGCAGKRFFVFHPAWGYLADAYGLEQVAVEIEGNVPTDRDLTELQQLARADGVRVIFVQPQISSASADALARAIEGRIQILDPLRQDIPVNLLNVAAAIAEALR
jgi:zinc transport system substrate-binding protein